DAEKDPLDWTTLLDGESIANKELALWYSATSSRTIDTFFQHGGFFSKLAGFADVGVAMTASPNPVGFADKITYSILVCNNRPLDATGIKLVDHLSPHGGSFDKKQSSNGCNYDSGQDQISCNIGSLAKGQSKALTIVIDVTDGLAAPGPIHNN